MNRLDFQKLAEARLLDAKALFGAGRFDAAHYLAGYVVECALKACISKLTREHDFPPKDTRVLYQHDLESLVKVSGIAELFLEDGYWEVVKEWKPGAIRYELQSASAEVATKTMLAAIDDGEHGVLRCLSKYW